MKRPFYVLKLMIGRKHLHRPLHRLLVALATTLPCVPLLADSAGNTAAANTVGAVENGIASFSGGVGEAARDEMRAIAAAYNVHMMFTEPGGAYLAGIAYTVALADGRQLHSGVSEGPLLYLQLPPGSYRIGARLDGVWQNRDIQASASGVPARLSFVSRRE